MESAIETPAAVVADEKQLEIEEKIRNANDKPTVVVRDTFEELEAFLRQYEIHHTVRFVTAKGDKRFNRGYEPWQHFKEKGFVPKLMWGSEYVEVTEKPYITIARKGYDCQYGKNKHAQKAQGTTKSSCKINCPVMMDVLEVLRLEQPRIKAEVTKYAKNALGSIYRNTMRALQRGEPTENPLRWKREFHMTIGPLSLHNHVIGEKAAGVQKIDTLLVRRIQQLASSGITSHDVVKDNLAHYVEEELFKGKKPPSKNNTRFYPKSRDIFNHMYREKDKLQKKTMLQNELDEVTQALADLNEGIDFSQQQGFKQPRYTYTSNGYAPCPDDQEQNVNEVSTYSTVTTSTESPRSSKLGMIKRAAAKRSPQERFLALVRKLHKIGSTIEDPQNLSKLSASLVEVIVKAKPMVPADQVEVIYEEEPRERLHPRRIRVYKKRNPQPRRQTHPDLNPLAPKPPDRKEMRKEAKRKAAEAIQRKAQEREAKKAEDLRRLAEKQVEKRKLVPITFAGSDIKYTIPLAEGEPLPKVIIVPNTKDGKKSQLLTTVLQNTSAPQIKRPTDPQTQSTKKGVIAMIPNQPTPKKSDQGSTRKTISVVKSENRSPQVTLVKSSTAQSTTNVIGHSMTTYPSILPKQASGASNSTIAVTSKPTDETKMSSTAVTTTTLASPITSMPSSTSNSHAKLITSSGVKVMTLPASTSTTLNSGSPAIIPKSSTDETLSTALGKLANNPEQSQEVLVVLNIPERT